MALKLALEEVVEFPDLLAFVAERSNWILSTARSEGRPQISPVTGGITEDGYLMVATYPERDKVHNLRRNPEVSICVLSDYFGGNWVQIDGRASVVDLPEAEEGLVDYYKAVVGEHPDWTEYREAMNRQGKCLIKIGIERWGPIAKGGFPRRLANLDHLTLDSNSDSDSDS
jgi:PPOX class probable F420-dependent enzyme